MTYPRPLFAKEKMVEAKVLPPEMQQAQQMVSYFDTFMLLVIVTNTIILALFHARDCGCVLHRSTTRIPAHEGQPSGPSGSAAEALRS